MSEIWVANASPIIVLAKCGYLELLTQLSRELLIPQAVVDEILAGPDDDPARQQVAAHWGQTRLPRQIPSGILEWGLGAGETSVLAVAQEMRAVAVLDDAAARACARVIGVPVIGSLGVIARAKSASLIPSAAEAFSKMRDVGLHVDDAIIARVLSAIGESWRAADE